MAERSGSVSDQDRRPTSVRCLGEKSGRASSFPRTPFICDGDKPNSVSPNCSGAMIIYLAPLARDARDRWLDSHRPPLQGRVMRRYPRIERTGCPSSVLSCTAWGFSCLAHYCASGELLPRLFNFA